MPIEGDRVVLVGVRPVSLNAWDVGLTGVVVEVIGEICVLEYENIPGQVWFRHQDDLVLLDQKGGNND